jgi:DNA-binding NarL/FixJ family response regulator
LSDEHSALTLTVRESQVLRYVTKGSSNKFIGAKLGVRESTVKVHVHNIMKKVGAHNRTELAVMLLQDGSPADALGRQVGPVDGQA